MHRQWDFSALQELCRSGDIKIPVGISSCLLGDKVRYNGDHKHSEFISGRLGEFLEFNKFCPEMEIGLGVPRTPIRLTRADGESIRCVQIDNADIDVTDSLRAIADQQVSWHRHLCGYIFKKGSPSCGVKDVKIWDGHTAEKFEKRGSGIYAEKFMENFPHIPVIDEIDLDDAVLCEEFLRRVINCWRTRSGNT